MKTASVEMQAHIDQETTSLAVLWEIVRKDGEEFYFTDHDRSITYDGNTYKASTGFTRTSIASERSMAVDNLDVQGIFDSDDIDQDDLRRGLFDGAEVKMRLVNFEDLTMGDIKLRRGTLGECILTEKGFFTSELRGLTQNLQQVIGQLYSPHCRVDLGGVKCSFSFTPPLVLRDTAYEDDDLVYVNDETNRSYRWRCTTPGTTDTDPVAYDPDSSPITDGTAVFEAEPNPFLQYFTVTEVVNRKVFSVSDTILADDTVFPNDWFNFGGLKFLSGNNDGKVIELKDFRRDDPEVGKYEFDLFLPMPFDVQVGDVFSIYAGCDKRISTCNEKFNNAINFRGEPHVPGNDFMSNYPDPK